MIKHFLTLYAITGLCVIAGAQQTLPVILLEARGKVQYRSPDNASDQQVIPGAVMKHGGILQLGKKGSAILFHDGQFSQIKGEQTAELAAQFNPGGTVPMNYDFGLGNYTMAAVSMAANPGNPQDAWGTVKTASGTGDGWGTVKSTSGTGDGWGTVKSTSGTGDGWGTVKTASGTGDGWGGHGNSIVAIFPYGKISDRKLTLFWSRPAGQPMFRVQIKDAENNLVAETTTRDTFWVVKLGKVNMMTGQSYSWQVTTEGSNPASSNKLSFMVGETQNLSATLKKVGSSPVYQQDPKVVGKLMKAVYLEQNDWFVAAARIYADLEKKHPENQMIRMMHAAFWVRYGLNPVAEKAFAGKLRN